MNIQVMVSTADPNIHGKATDNWKNKKKRNAEMKEWQKL